MEESGVIQLSNSPWASPAPDNVLLECALLTTLWPSANMTTLRYRLLELSPPPIDLQLVANKPHLSGGPCRSVQKNLSWPG